METQPSLVFAIGVLLIGGLFAGLLFSRLGLPRIVGYIVVGVLCSPKLLGDTINLAPGAWSEHLTEIALGIIAFIIGGSITATQLRRIGKIILLCAVFESTAAVLVVLFVLYFVAAIFFPQDAWPIALGLAGIAATTAPAGTVAILHQFRARGPLTTTLLGVVALDDALGIIYFSFIAILVGSHDVILSIEAIGLEIGVALVAGFVSGRFLTWLSGAIRQGTLRLPVVFGTILLLVGLSESLSFSPLLASIVMGFTARNSLKAGGDKLFAPIEYLEELVFVLFFTLAGTHFNAEVIVAFFPLVVAYFVARIVGKIIGAYIGGVISSAPVAVSRWLGLALVPQAGVAIGLALALAHIEGYEEVGAIIVNVILGTTVIYEIVGPLMAKLALSRAGELGEKRERPAHESR